MYINLERESPVFKSAQQYVLAHENSYELLLGGESELGGPLWEMKEIEAAD